MKKKLENQTVAIEANSNWAMRTSMLAVLAAATPAIAHADTASVMGSSAASAASVEAVRPQIIFVPGTGMPASFAASTNAIAVATSAVPAVSAAGQNDTHRDIFIPVAISSKPDAKREFILVPGMGTTSPESYVASPATAGLSQASPNIEAPVPYIYSNQADVAPMANNVMAIDDSFDIKFRADTLVVTPVLNVGLVESVRTAASGETISFMGYTNYPAFIDKAEVRVFRATQSPDAEPMKVLAVDGNGTTSWTVPDNAPSAMFYVYRVYGRGGKFDETTPQELIIVDKALAQSKSAQPVTRPNFGTIDEAARRNIELDGLMATVTGRANPSSDVVRVSGQFVPVDENGRFVSQQIVSRSDGNMVVTVDRDGKRVARTEQSFAAPKDEWFVVGQGDLTLGKSYGSGPAEAVSGDSLASGKYAIGRAAFYA